MGMGYIKKEKLLRAIANEDAEKVFTIADQGHPYLNVKFAAKTLRAVIDGLETVDAEVVTHCKNCEIKNMCKFTEILGENGFCSNAIDEDDERYAILQIHTTEALREKEVFSHRFVLQRKTSFADKTDARSGKQCFLFPRNRMDGEREWLKIKHQSIR